MVGSLGFGVGKAGLLWLLSEQPTVPATRRVGSGRRSEDWQGNPPQRRLRYGAAFTLLFSTRTTIDLLGVCMDLNDFGTQCDGSPRQPPAENAFYHHERNFLPQESPT